MVNSASSHVEAHAKSSNHRDELLESDCCGCFYCQKVFESQLIKEWIDEVDAVATTELCPFCGIDSVVGSASGYSIDAAFLKRMHDYWF
jgi:hypothetical protein